MTKSRSSVFLEVIESLSKGTFISEGDVQGLAREVLIQASQLLNVDRVNAWTLSGDEKQLDSLLAYDRNRNEFYVESPLLKRDFPYYFEHVSKNDILISSDAQNEPFNRELREVYLMPLNICSMMEVPIISGGKFKGVTCFEHLGNLREWNNDEQHFALALTQLLTLALETRDKNQYREELEKLVKEKSVLIAEINHRVKNNLAIIDGILELNKLRNNTDSLEDFLSDIQTRIKTIALVHEKLYKSETFSTIDIKDYITEIVNYHNRMFISRNNLKADFQTDVGDGIHFTLNRAIPFGLLVSELISNSLKHAKVPNILRIDIKIFVEEDVVFLHFADSGQGLPQGFDISKSKGFGFRLIMNLTKQLKGEYSFPEGNRFKYVLELKK